MRRQLGSLLNGVWQDAIHAPSSQTLLFATKKCARKQSLRFVAQQETRREEVRKSGSTANQTINRREKRMVTTMRSSIARKRSVVILTRIVTLLIIACCIVWIYLFINPADRIKVSVSLLPIDTIYISFVAESKDTIQNMNWYQKSELGIPFIVSPSESVWSSLEFKDVPKLDWDAYVQWREGERYGVVTKNRVSTWHVTWLTANDVPIKRHRFILGNGEANFDLSKGKTVELPVEQLRNLHLDDFPFLDR